MSGQGSADHRDAARRRTRLRSGKIVDGANRFLIECAIHDRSEDGARLRLAHDITLPAEIRLFDDERGVLFAASIIWHRGAEIGVRLSAEPVPARAADLLALQHRYYAVR